VTDGKDKAGVPRGSEVMTLGSNEVRNRRGSLAAAWGAGDLRWTGYPHPGCFFVRATDKGLTLDPASRYPPAGATLDVFSVARELVAGLAEGFLNTEGAEHTERKRGKEGRGEAGGFGIAIIHQDSMETDYCQGTVLGA